MLPAWTTQGEMGTGTPQFGFYSDAAYAGGKATVWGMKNISTPFPSGCSNITLTANTMGVDSFKQALAVMITAQALGKSVR